MSRRPCQCRQRAKIPTDERFFLFPPPSLDPSFARDSVFQPDEVRGPHQLHGPTRMRVAGEPAGMMIGDASVQASARKADIIGTVFAAKHVDEDFHVYRRPSRSPFGKLRVR